MCEFNYGRLDYEFISDYIFGYYNNYKIIDFVSLGKI